MILGSTGFGGERWDEKSWPQSVYRGCLSRRTRFVPHGSFGNVRFESCVFDRARLTGMTSTTEAEFVDCTFVGRIRNNNFWGSLSWNQEQVGRDSNAFTGNDFSGAELEWNAFHGIDLEAQRFPGLPNHALVSCTGEGLAAAHRVIDAWPDARDADDARSCLERYTSRGDRALVVRAELGLKIPPTLREEILRALVADQTQVQ